MESKIFLNVINNIIKMLILLKIITFTHNQLIILSQNIKVVDLPTNLPTYLHICYHDSDLSGIKGMTNKLTKGIILLILKEGK